VDAVVAVEVEEALMEGEETLMKALQNALLVGSLFPILSYRDGICDA